MASIGIIGFGNMGSAIAGAIKSEFEVYAFDKDRAKLSQADGVCFLEDVPGIVEKSEVIIFAVKPQDFTDLFKEIKILPRLTDKLFISIAAGITTRYIEENLCVARVVRVMPNMGIRVGSGISCLCPGSYASVEDFDLAQDIFEYAGETVKVGEEKMNAVTALSGSGPGFFYYLVQNKPTEEIRKLAGDFAVSLKIAAQELGFDEQTAGLLAKATAIGSAAYLEKTHITAMQALKQVASKGGTTEAGLEVLKKGAGLTEAVKAALKRAQELSGG